MANLVHSFERSYDGNQKIYETQAAGSTFGETLTTPNDLVYTEVIGFV